jgi:hypothetical protein
VRQFKARADAAETPEPFPEDHLLSVPFAVPPGLFAKKWIVVNTRSHDPATCLRWANLDLDTEDGKHDRVRLTFGDDSSEWQAQSCRHENLLDMQRYGTH